MTAISLAPANAQAYLDAAAAYQQSADLNQVVRTLQVGIERCAPSQLLYRKLIRILEDLNRTEEAIGVAREALKYLPDDLVLRFREAFLLPVLYDSNEEIERYRRRYSAGLQSITDRLDLQSSFSRLQALNAVSSYDTFLLGYQGLEDVELQRAYGAIVHRIMRANYPHVSVATEGTQYYSKRIRVGFVSSCFFHHTVLKLFCGWLDLPTDRFETYAYHLGERVDVETDRVRRQTTFRHLNRGFIESYQRIIDDKVNVLIYLDIGMDPKAKKLASLRLAPVQCVAWGHPVTSGLASVDYFLSSELMERSGAQRSYSESLVRLPGIGVAYKGFSMSIAAFLRTRREFGLDPSSVVYLSSQTHQKYLPEQDHLLAEIAARVPRAQFVFIARNPSVSDVFRRRLERAFALQGVPVDRFVILPQLDQLSYWNLNAISDVFVDTIGWSGGLSTLEAISCGLPVVTLPGMLMRSRHSYGILKYLKCEQGIASSEKEFVDISVRLGSDAAWRNQMARDLSSKCAAMYNDSRVVAALGGFLEDLSRERKLL